MADLEVRNDGKRFERCKYILRCTICGKPVVGSDKPLSTFVKMIVETTPCSRCAPPRTDLSGIKIKLDKSMTDLLFEE
jgi:hypothetical protein